MDRAAALEEAIGIVRRSPSVGARRKAELIGKLELCLHSLPVTDWTKAAILDACDQYQKDHGSIPADRFAYRGLPSERVLRDRFGLSRTLFRDTYYPLPERAGPRPVDPARAAACTERFIREYHRMRCHGQRMYDRQRSQGAPAWTTVARLNGVRTWKELQEKLGLEKYRRDPEDLEVRLWEGTP